MKLVTLATFSVFTALILLSTPFALAESEPRPTVEPEVTSVAARPSGAADPATRPTPSEPAESSAATIAVPSSTAAPAGRGTIILESDTWDSICKVEIVKGMNAPNRGPRSSYSNVKKGRTFSASDRICYRRSGRPRDCGSSMTQWTCCSHLISGSDTCSLS